MFRNHPLTCLFIAATLAFDMAVTNLGPFQWGLVLGQVGCSAIWAVTGKAHRLARAGGLLAIIGLLALLFPASHGLGLQYSVAYIFGPYAALVVVILAACRLVMSLYNRGATESRRLDQWRFPVVELFGWTIVVAVACLFGRTIDFEFLLDQGFWAMLVWATTVGLAWLLLRGNIVRHLVLRLILLALGAFAMASVLDRYELLAGFPAGVIAMGQVMYVAAWLAICRLDEQHGMQLAEST